MLTDLVVVLAGAIVYKDIETILYGLIMIYANGEIINKIVKGADARWMVLAMSSKREEISKRIIKEVDRGTTLMNGEGGYSGLPVDMLLCVVDSQEMFALKHIIKEADPKAFVIVSQTSEILGEGFKNIHSEG